MNLKNRTFHFFLALLCAAGIPLLSADEGLTDSVPPQAKNHLEKKQGQLPASVAAPAAMPRVATDAEQVSEVLNEYLATIRSYDLSKAYYAYMTKDFQKATPLDTFKAFVKKYSVLFRNKQVIQDKITFKSNTANFTGKLISTDGETYNVDLTFIHDEDWRIHSIVLKETPQARVRPIR